MTRLESLYEEMAKRKMVASKKEFAEKLGFAYANLARYLSGQLKTTIDAENYRKFAESGINIDWLLTGEGEMFINDVAESAPLQITPQGGRRSGGHSLLRHRRYGAHCGIAGP